MSKRRTRLYFAFGSNMDHDQMKLRCPKAKFLTKVSIPNSALVFRGGLADAVPRQGANLYGAAWLITHECELTLDRYEGVASGLYFKDEVPVRAKGKDTSMLIYRMLEETDLVPPTDSYLGGILQGFDHCGWSDKSSVLHAVEEAECAYEEDGCTTRSLGRAARERKQK